MVFNVYIFFIFYFISLFEETDLKTHEKILRPMPLGRIFFEGQKHDLIKPRTLTHEGKYFDGDIVEKTTKEIKHIETKLRMQN